MDRELIQRLVALEWEFFQATRNEGGRAPCQDDRETFWVMRTGQAMGWSEEMAAAWLSDLEAARTAGRNPVMEKYARMMAFTAPEAYAKLAHFLPPVEPEMEKLAGLWPTRRWPGRKRRRSGTPISAPADGPFGRRRTALRSPRWRPTATANC